MDRVMDDVVAEENSASKRFPVEVLSLVFEHLRPSRSKLPSGRPMHSDDNSLMSILHVNRFWREVAFAHAVLWASEVDVSAHPHPNLTAIVLAKSGNHPLDIKLHYVTQEYDRAILAMWFKDPYRSRIRSIDIETTGECAKRRLVKVISSDLPSVRTLKLLNEADQDPELMNGSYEEPPAMDLPIVAALPLQRAPALERIELRDYALSWTLSQLYAGVTHLEVHFSASEPFNHLPTHAQLNAVVTSMNSLEALILDDVFPMYSGVEPQSSIPVPSTCRSITLRAKNFHGNCRLLASALTLPSQCNLTIAQVCRERGDAEEGDVITYLAGFRRRPQVASVRTDDTTGEQCGEFSVGYDASPYLTFPESLLPSSTIPAPHTTFIFEVTTQTIEQDVWDEEDSETVSYDRMQVAMTHVDLTEVHVLRLDEMREPDEFHICNGMQEYTGERTTPVLATAENVEILILGDPTLHILMFLQDPNSMTGKLLLPRLTTVVIPENASSYSGESLRGYFNARLEDGLNVPGVRAPRHLRDTDFEQKLGEGVNVIYF